MTPIYLSSSLNDYSVYPTHDEQNEHQFLRNPNSQDSSSTNSLTCHLFLNSSAHDHDQSGFLHKDHLHPPQEGDCYDHERGSNNGGLKFSLWKSELNDMKDENQVKWMSSKMRVMLKMKKSDPTKKMNTFTKTTREEVKLEEQKLIMSPMEDTTINSIKSTSSNNMVPIRVCSDCNTTKTPLWRSGPRGPKSLCNACGIRQRKARKAMAAAAVAAAAATENRNNDYISQPTTASSLKVTKIRHKDHKKPNNKQVTKHKKRQYSKEIKTTSSPSSSSSLTRKNYVEELLVSLNKKLTFHRVFPQDEKEAAILLMALSCGYVHE